VWSRGLVDRADVDPQRVPEDQRLRHLAPCAPQDAPERLPRHAHAARSPRVLEPFEIGEPDGFELVERHADLRERGDAAGLEQPRHRSPCDLAGCGGSCHGTIAA
jgi:hypothetical protein